MCVSRRLPPVLYFFSAFAFSLISLFSASAQQIYHGDGVTNDGKGNWTTASAKNDQCLKCHQAGGAGSDISVYLVTGHKNMLRKVVPGVLWNGADGQPYPTTDDHYQSGSIYDWIAGKVTVGGCLPASATTGNGLGLPLDPCPGTYPLYGQSRNIFYIFGGWSDKTQLNTAFDGGFTGEQYPNGNYDCARCHTTGYSFDATGPEPSYLGQKIPDTSFSRIPTDLASSTSSWHLDGVQCERCHNADNGINNHTVSGAIAGGVPTRPRNQQATAVCLQCHREETADTVANTITLTTPTSGGGSSYLIVSDGGYCSDLMTPDYATCASSGATWNYAPFLDHESGPTFLNGPHARLNGTLALNSQNSPDLSLNVMGTYSSSFTDAATGNNGGCIGCHDAHQTPSASPNPFRQQCNDCHSLAHNILATTSHPAGPGTPFPTGTDADIPGACVTCHMSQNYHLFRISTDPNYSTFPTPAQLYDPNHPQAAPNMAAENYPPFGLVDGGAMPTAVWSDVDLACGQCHVGNDGVTPSYGLALPPGMPGAHAYTKAQLASWAKNIHGADPGVPTPTPLPLPGMFTAPQTVSISDAMDSATIYYTMDGSVPTTHSAVYTTAIPISATATFHAIAMAAGMPASHVMSATYTISLPAAPAPRFWPPASTYVNPPSITLSNTANLAMYYTTDGSTPTTGSTLYAGPISVTKNMTINAIAAGTGYLASPVSSGPYVIQGPAPTFSPSSGTYYGAQTVKISDTTSGATIYYTTDGTVPTTSSTPCANPCTLTASSTETVKAIASGGGYASSSVSVATYAIAAQNPTFSPAAGTYYMTTTVTISDATPGVTIYYTLNGGFPTTSSPNCASPCKLSPVISANTTIRAMALGTGISQSGTAVAAYTIAAMNPVFSLASGTYKGTQNITITDGSGSVTIYYTTNGAIPTTTNSTACSAPCSITVSTSTLFKAMAAGPGISQSGVALASYTIQ